MMRKVTLAPITALVLSLAACGQGPNVEPQAQPRSVEAPADPYETYLATAPARPQDWVAEWPLSAADAQARALAGCGTEWAPGTIDAALAAAYTDLCP